MENNSLYRLSIFTKKIQLKASIPSTCSSVSISGHRFACNGKTTKHVCCILTQFINFETKESKQISSLSVEKYFLPFSSQ